jgi:hypothetical protein
MGLILVHKLKGSTRWIRTAGRFGGARNTNAHARSEVNRTFGFGSQTQSPAKAHGATCRQSYPIAWRSLSCSLVVSAARTKTGAKKFCSVVGGRYGRRTPSHVTVALSIYRSTVWVPIGHRHVVHVHRLGLIRYSSSTYKGGVLGTLLGLVHALTQGMAPVPWQQSSILQAVGEGRSFRIF